MKKNRKRRPMKVEGLEVRRYLTVEATLSDGDLVISGDADGEVKVTAVAEGSYEVTDNGVAVGTISEVTDDIRIKLAGEDEGANDQVSINLGEETVDRVFVQLGQGDNSLTVTGGNLTGGLSVMSGSGDDVIQIDSAMAGSLQAWLGGGANSITINSSVGKSVNVRTGGGDDTVTLSESATVGGDVRASLGGGSNTLNHNGKTSGNLVVRSASEGDTVNVAEGSVEGEQSIRLGVPERGFGRGGHHHGRGGALGMLAGRGSRCGDSGEENSDDDSSTDDGTSTDESSSSSSSTGTTSSTSSASTAVSGASSEGSARSWATRLGWLRRGR